MIAVLESLFYVNGFFVSDVVGHGWVRAGATGHACVPINDPDRITPVDQTVAHLITEPCEDRRR